MAFNKDNIGYIKITFPPSFCVSPCIIIYSNIIQHDQLKLRPYFLP